MFWLCLEFWTLQSYFLLEIKNAPEKHKSKIFQKNVKYQKIQTPLVSVSKVLFWRETKCTKIQRSALKWFIDFFVFFFRNYFNADLYSFDFFCLKKNTFETEINGVFIFSCFAFFSKIIPSGIYMFLLSFLVQKKYCFNRKQ